MWKFFHPREGYFFWSWGGTLLILAGLWSIVQIEVILNDFFKKFYDFIQLALSGPNKVTVTELYSLLFEFAGIAAIFVIINVLINGFFVNHYCFRWRQSITEYYQKNWEHAMHVEGASQRLQEDALKWARLTESNVVELIQSAMMLFAFVPILYELSAQVTEIPIIGEVDRGLVWAVLTTTIIGTFILVSIGFRLPGIEFDIQKEEAAYRKKLVKAEDDIIHANEKELVSLFEAVRRIHFRAYLNYMIFNTAKWSYLQFSVIFPYLIMSPTIISGVVTLGFVSQTTRAFGKVSESLQFLIRSWLSIVELISVYKRLRGFERKFLENKAQ